MPTAPPALGSINRMRPPLSPEIFHSRVGTFCASTRYASRKSRSSCDSTRYSNSIQFVALAGQVTGTWVCKELQELSTPACAWGRCGIARGGRGPPR